MLHVLFLFQFPSMMEFLPAFLINVWDSALTPVFHTFLFDCDHDRTLALQVHIVVKQEKGKIYHLDHSLRHKLANLSFC